MFPHRSRLSRTCSRGAGAGGADSAAGGSVRARADGRAAGDAEPNAGRQRPHTFGTTADASAAMCEPVGR